LESILGKYTLVLTLVSILVFRTSRRF
jgi:hypothetical protein